MGSASKYKGVSFDKHGNKWIVSISRDGIRHKVGRFKTEKDAAIAYDNAAKKYFGEFAYLNFPLITSNTEHA